MNSAIERLLTLQVIDVMTKSVISVLTQDTMASAARTLRKHSISGVPVVDEHKRCTGVLSAHDFVEKQSCTCRLGQESALQRNREDEEKQAAGAQHELDLVSQHMTPIVYSVGADDSLLTAAKIMCAKHIHRLPVLDTQARPIGIITALDVVASLVNSIEE